MKDAKHLCLSVSKCGQTFQSETHGFLIVFIVRFHVDCFVVGFTILPPRGGEGYLATSEESGFRSRAQKQLGFLK